MYFLYLSIISVFFVHALCAMDFHQRFVDDQCCGVDLRVVVPLANHDEYLPHPDQRTSIRQLFDACNSNGQCPLNTIGLYALVKDTVVEYGTLASCDQRKQLLASCMASLYVLYKDNGKEKRALLFGTSDARDSSLLTKYLILKASLIKETTSPSRDNTITLNDMVKYCSDRKLQEKAV